MDDITCLSIKENETTLSVSLDYQPTDSEA